LIEWLLSRVRLSVLTASALSIQWLIGHEQGKTDQFGITMALTEPCRLPDGSADFRGLSDAAWKVVMMDFIRFFTGRIIRLSGQCDLWT